MASSLAQKGILICLGAGQSQLPVITTARQAGYSVLGIDRNPNAPGIQHLDEFINVSTYETAKVIEMVREFQCNYEFAGLVARTSGPALKTAATIAETFQLSGLSSELIPLATKKSVLREFCCRNQLPVPPGIRVQSAKKFNNKLEAPVIIKPDLPLVGKKAVRVMDDFKSIEAAVESARQASYNGYVEIEKYIDGIDIGCLFWANRGRTEILAYWDELVGVTNENTVIGLGISLPSVIEKTETQKSVNTIVQEFASRLPCLSALLIMAFRVEMTGKAHVIELHADLGGDLIADELFPVADPRFNYFGLAVSIACDTPIKLSQWLPNFNPTSLLYKPSMKENRVQITVTKHHDSRAYFCKSGTLKENLKQTFSLIDDSKLALMPKHLSWYEMRR